MRALILEYRQLIKLQLTYVDALPQLVCELDGRVHTTFNQAVTATGRLSTTNPNLQNIPIRTEKGREIRKAFVPRDKNHVLALGRLLADRAAHHGRLQQGRHHDGGLPQRP